MYQINGQSLIHNIIIIIIIIIIIVVVVVVRYTFYFYLLYKNHVSITPSSTPLFFCSFIFTLK